MTGIRGREKQKELGRGIGVNEDKRKEKTMEKNKEKDQKSIGVLSAIELKYSTQPRTTPQLKRMR